MLYTEFNLDEAKEIWRDEGYEDGIEKGRKEERLYFLDQLNQGCSIEEIKKRLVNNETQVFCAWHPMLPAISGPCYPNLPLSLSYNHSDICR